MATSPDAHLDGIDLPEDLDDDAYESILADEGLAPPPRGRRLLRWIVAVITLAAIVRVFVL